MGERRQRLADIDKCQLDLVAGWLGSVKTVSRVWSLKSGWMAVQLR